MDPSPIKLRDILCRGREREGEEGTYYNLTMVYTLHTHTPVYYTTSTHTHSLTHTHTHTHIHPYTIPQATTHTFIKSRNRYRYRMLGFAYFQNFEIIPRFHCMAFLCF